MVQSALMHDVLPRQLSLKHCPQLWVSASVQTRLLELRELSILFYLMSQKIVANRPGRIEPRVVKRKPKAYPLLTKPRAIARAEVIKLGHPKKLK
jgi:hypothetical protein